MGEAPLSERENGIVTLRPNVTSKSDCPPHQRAVVTPFHGKLVTRSSHGSQKTGESQLQSRSEFSPNRVIRKCPAPGYSKWYSTPRKRIVPETGLELGTLRSVVLHATTRPILRGYVDIYKVLYAYMLTPCWHCTAFYHLTYSNSNNSIHITQWVIEKL